MSWYPDLGTVTMVASGDHVRAVGWLSDEHSFPTGDCDPAFLDKLKVICHRWKDGLQSLGWGMFRGRHGCELCRRDRVQASGNIGVPDGDTLYVAPEMVAHYIEAHRYAPPAEFVAAVLASPLPGTKEYEEAVAAIVRDP